MLDETFSIDGVSAKSVGIQLQNPIVFSEPVPIYEKEHIPGRNGDLIFETGCYENRDGLASCFVMQKDVIKSLNATNKFLLSKNGYRKLETSDDPDHFWMARVKNGAQIEQRLRILAPFEIEFDCKPQRFVKSGNYPKEVLKYEIFCNFFGFTAKPLFSIYGEGEGKLIVGNTVIPVNIVDNVLHIDSETQNAYNNAGYQNMNIDAPEFPVFPYGETVVKFTGGIERVVVYPRWWEL